MLSESWLLCTQMRDSDAGRADVVVNVVYSYEGLRQNRYGFIWEGALGGGGKGQTGTAPRPPCQCSRATPLAPEYVYLLSRSGAGYCK